MFSKYQSEIFQNLFRLSQLNAGFFHRTMLLSASSAESFGQRFHRFQTECGEKIMDGFFRLAQNGPAQENAEIPEKVALECSEAYMQEVRNSEQVALITYDEMRVWLDSFFKEWRRLANSALD